MRAMDGVPELTGMYSQRLFVLPVISPIRVILQPVAVLAAFKKLGHILMYAPQFFSFAALPQTE
ncbi:hypothetical protein L9H26_13450 [Morganella psychrotolerans]|uniref:Uncharacterized protein n=1 Tax=Morganella psychrotolerans TaxID=368603 RepID=A0A5M9R396_9GAMM|nr:hypothetical protein [Morganella psychrotolerans]KAA8714878.1 hypothetical protein F4V73_13660 [Morganella psychrotolerans]OBU04606.1 hypothetical protein AYY16_12685 [Morganella psychrotolerans]